MSWSINSQGIPSAENRTGNEYTMTKGFFLFTSDASFASLASAGTKSAWLALVTTDKCFPMHSVKNLEDGSKAADKQEFQDGSEATMRELQRGYVAYFNWTLDQHKVAMSYKDLFQYFAPYDEANNILMKSEDGTVVKPRKIGSIQIDPVTVGLPGAKPLTKVTIIEADYSEWDADGLTIQPNKGTVATRWRPTEILPITTLKVTQVGTIGTNAYTVDVAFKSMSDITNTGDYSVNRAIEGLLAENFQSLDNSGVIVAITGVAATSPAVAGRYVVSHASFTAGTCQILASSTMLYASEKLTLV